MKINDIIKPVEEGINDPHIFKAVFMAGGPGSGKSFVAKKMLRGTGLKMVNSDEVFELIMNKDGIEMTPDNVGSDAGQERREKAKVLTMKRKNIFLDGKLGVVIDGTGKDVMKIGKIKDRLEGLGYDSMMLFVNTSLDVAKERNLKRDRSVPEDMVVDMWKQVQDNIMKFQQMFGAPNFYVIDNSGGLEDPARQKNFAKVDRAIDKFLIKPPTKRVARDWIRDNTKTTEGWGAILSAPAGAILSQLPRALKGLGKGAKVAGKLMRKYPKTTMGLGYAASKALGGKDKQTDNTPTTPYQSTVDMGLAQAGRNKAAGH